MTGAGVRVALDVQALQVAGWADRGVGRYVIGYSTALARRGALAAALLAPELPPPSGLPNELVAAGLVSWDTAAAARGLAGAGGSPLAYHLTAPFLHSEPGGPAGLAVVEHWARAAVPRVVLLHDLIPLRAPRHYLHTPGHEERYRARAGWVAAADLVVTNSEYTRHEAISLLGCRPERVVTIGVGVSPYFTPADGTDEELWRFHFAALAGRPHLVTVGGSDVRKGTDQAIAALALLAARGLDLSLLVLGHLPAHWRHELRLTAAACGVSDRVFIGGAVDDELLRACYRRAELSLMPSLAEGAGLPVLESAACGTPALASGTTALAETAGTPMACFDPSDADSIAAAVEAAVDSPARRAAILGVQTALASASTWDAVAGRAVAAIHGLWESGQTGSDARAAARGPAASATSDWPARLAVVGWLPGRDGRLDRLVAAWPGEVDPVCSTVEGRRVDPVNGTVVERRFDPGGGPTERRRVDPAAFGTDVRPASYDAVVYVLTGGGSGVGTARGTGDPAAAGDEDEVWRLAGRYPGWLWLSVPCRAVIRNGGFESLVRRSCGVIVESDEDRWAVRLALRPGAAVPPIVVASAGDEVTALLGVPAPATDRAGSGAGRALP